jgi:hypothetical protein
MKHLTAFAIVVALSLTVIPAAGAQQTAPRTAQSSAEINRQVIQQDKAGYVAALVSRWESEATASGKWDSNSNYSADMFAALMSLGTDNLLLAGQATSFQGVMDVLKAGSRPVSSNQLGDFGDDTVYTPVNPCRIVDTRVAGGPYSGTRTFDVDNPTSFAFQGGNNGPCGIPFGVASSVLMTITVTGSPTGGFITAWGLGTQPLSSVLNYAAGETVANSTVIPVVPGGGNDFSIFASGQTQVIVDVQGYFAEPVATAVDSNITVSSFVPLAAGLASYDAFSPVCPAGFRLTGGGAVMNSYSDNPPVGSRPVANGSVAIISGLNSGNQWLAQGNTLGKGATSISVFAICSRVPGR